MALFWFLAGMLTTLAILCVLLPWLRTIPRLETLPTLPWQAPLVAVLMMAAALFLYRWLGRPDLVQAMADGAAGTPAMAPNGPATASGASSAGSMQTALNTLRSRLTKGGGSSEDWELLAKSYEFMGRPEDAARAHAHSLPDTDAPSAAAPQAASLTPLTPSLSPETLQQLAKANRARSDKQYAAALVIYAQLAAKNQLNADAWADYADAAGSAQQGKLTGTPETYIAKALALDATQPKALWLKASADEEAGRMSAAIATWRQLLGVLPADSEDAKLVAGNLQRDSESAGVAREAPASPASAVNGKVSLAKSLQDKAPADGVLFIVAKSVDSPGAPVAVFRSSVGAWPVSFTLDDSQSMLPGRNLSSAGRITVEARISRSGQAAPSSGDLRGRSPIISAANRAPLNIVIDELIP